MRSMKSLVAEVTMTEDVANCACASIDARNCFRTRYCLNMINGDDLPDSEPDVCECPCHDAKADSDVMECGCVGGHEPDCLLRPLTGVSDHPACSCYINPNHCILHGYDASEI